MHIVKFPQIRLAALLYLAYYATETKHTSLDLIVILPYASAGKPTPY